MSHNTFGKLFRVTTWGESHGPAIGCVIDGTPPGLTVTESVIQPYLDKRRPGTSRHTSQRQEADRVRILSGVMDGVTTGTPISLIIENQDQRSKDYSENEAKFRPGHADITYQLKYGLRDHRGGGRSSARETSVRVAAGAIARVVLAKMLPDATVRGALVQVGNHAIDGEAWDWTEVERNLFWCPDPAAAKKWEQVLDEVRKSGSSVGAIIQIEAQGIPPGLGAPLYGKLDADMAAALMSINAVKGVEIGEGFGAASLSGEENADEIRAGTETGLNNAQFLSNHAGGILGGISTGQPVVARFAVKPTSSILTPRQTVNLEGTNTDISTKGRHDPCVGIRAVPVGEAMVACVLADHLLRHRGQIGT